MEPTDKDIELFISTLQGCSEYDFSDYSFKSLKRRLAKILADFNVTIEILTGRIREDRTFLELVVRETTVNTTELFRDPVVWQQLRWKILPLLKERNPIYMWSAGCSTGLEVYSLKILACEMGIEKQINIIGTDLNQQALDQAKQGTFKYRFNLNYLDNFDKVMKENPSRPLELIDVPYNKYFIIDQIRDIIKIKDNLAEGVIYEKHDLVKNTSAGTQPFDLILCRNVIIYFNNRLQNQVFKLFHDSLATGGYLLLGTHESILGAYHDKFAKEGNFYRKIGREFYPAF
jgi:chemotaxis protein methyltransferase CheR